jgi:hypothetical protein
MVPTDKELGESDDKEHTEQYTSEHIELSELSDPSHSAESDLVPRHRVLSVTFSQP